MKTKSDYAILDVTEGRERLLETVTDARVPVTITGYVTCLYSDNGVSMEFEVDVTSATFGAPVPAA